MAQIPQISAAAFGAGRGQSNAQLGRAVQQTGHLAGQIHLDNQRRKRQRDFQPVAIEADYAMKEALAARAAEVDRIEDAHSFAAETWASVKETNQTVRTYLETYGEDALEDFDSRMLAGAQNTVLQIKDQKETEHAFRAVDSLFSTRFYPEMHQLASDENPQTYAEGANALLAKANGLTGEWAMTPKGKLYLDQEYNRLATHLAENAPDVETAKKLLGGVRGLTPRQYESTLNQVERMVDTRRKARLARNKDHFDKMKAALRDGLSPADYEIRAAAYLQDLPQDEHEHAVQNMELSFLVGNSAAGAYFHTLGQKPDINVPFGLHFNRKIEEQFHPTQGSVWKTLDRVSQAEREAAYRAITDKNPFDAQGGFDEKKAQPYEFLKSVDPVVAQAHEQVLAAEQPEEQQQAREEMAMILSQRFRELGVDEYEHNPHVEPMRRHLQQALGPNFAPMQRWENMVQLSLGQGDYVGSTFQELIATEIVKGKKPNGAELVLSFGLDGTMGPLQGGLANVDVIGFLQANNADRVELYRQKAAERGSSNYQALVSFGDNPEMRAWSGALTQHLGTNASAGAAAMQSIQNYAAHLHLVEGKPLREALNTARDFAYNLAVPLSPNEGEDQPSTLLPNHIFTRRANLVERILGGRQDDRSHYRDFNDLNTALQGTLNGVVMPSRESFPDFQEAWPGPLNRWGYIFENYSRLGQSKQESALWAQTWLGQAKNIYANRFEVTDEKTGETSLYRPVPDLFGRMVVPGAQDANPGTEFLKKFEILANQDRRQWVQLPMGGGWKLQVMGVTPEDPTRLTEGKVSDWTDVMDSETGLPFIVSVDDALSWAADYRDLQAFQGGLKTFQPQKVVRDPQTGRFRRRLPIHEDIDKAKGAWEAYRAAQTLKRKFEVLTPPRQP